MTMTSGKTLGDLAANLLGAARAPARSEPAATTAVPTVRATLLASQAAAVLGVPGPAGDRTLSGMQNMLLRGLLQESALLGMDLNRDRIDQQLKTTRLILADRGGDAGSGLQAAQCLSFLTQDTASGTALCVFTDVDTLLAFADLPNARPWVTPAAKVWAFAVHLLRAAVIIDPGSPHATLIDGDRLLQFARG